MTWGLGGAFAAAVAYGIATVLQAMGARRGDGATDELDARLLLRLLHSLRYVVGLGLDGVGFALSFAALRSEPLFTVQAIVASSLAVTALVAVFALKSRPRLLEWLALGVVTAGLTLLAVAVSPQHQAQLDWGGRMALLVVVGVVGAAAVVIARRRPQGGTGDAWAFGMLAGLMYGAGGISAHVLPTPHHLVLVLVDPALFAMVGAGILGLLLYAMALQRGSVTVATGAVVVMETLVPAAVGVTVLGDHPAHGRTAIAALGFSLSVAGALALARYGEAPASVGTSTA